MVYRLIMDNVFLCPCDVIEKPIVDIGMSIHQKSNPNQSAYAISSQSDEIIPQPPQAMVINRVNWIGLQTLYMKEVRRFMKVQLQTIWAPAITTLLYLAIFTLSLGRGGRAELGVPFADFLAPGLIVMGMVQNAFANSSFSLLVGKVQGTIVDYLMPPLSNAELLFAMIAASVTRAFMVGGAVWLVMLFWPGVHVMPAVPLVAFVFGFLGSVFVALIGLMTSIWAEKFDHAALISNFVIAPLSLLSGTFYSVDRLAPAFQMISHANPFFYIISGFRYGFLGRTDSNIYVGAMSLTVLNIILGFVVFHILRSGWKLRN
jgi:ABC-2 type transport system permease protein